MEGTSEKDGENENRMGVVENISMQDLADSYMRPFNDCVQKGNVSGLMCCKIVMLSRFACCPSR